MTTLERRVLRWQQTRSERDWQRIEAEAFPAVLAYVLRTRHLGTEGPEIKQQIRMGLFRAAERWQPGRAAYLTLAVWWARGQIAQFFRDAGRRQEWALIGDMDTLEALAGAVEAIPSVEDLALRLAMARLSPLQQAVLWERAAGHTLQEIADLHGWSHRNTAVWHLRAASNRISRGISAHA